MDILVKAGNTLGENPLWDERAGCLYWTDIDGGSLHRYAGGAHDVIYTGAHPGEKVGGFTLQEDGSLLLFRVADLARLEPGRAAQVLLAVQEPGLARFNDVIAAPDGGVLAGTIGETETSGGLYRVRQDGSLEKLWGGTKISNGMGFSPDLKSFYWTDSTARRVYRFSYDDVTHQLTGRDLIYEAPAEEGTPDGLAVAADGSFFSARYGGGALVHHAPDGAVLARLPVAAENVTSVAFGGPDSSELFITTAQGGGAGAGALFHHRAGLKGRPEFRSSVLL